MFIKVLILILCVYVALSSAAKFTSAEVKCHVCKAVVQEIEEIVSKVDPTKRIDVSGFRLDADGNSISKSVSLAKSELFLNEVMENVCKKMEEYLKATYKKTGKFTLLKIMVDGKMNPESSIVDFVQDGDLNKSLEYYCQEILEDQEDAFLKGFQAQNLSDNLDIKICSELSNYCEHAPIEDDYNFDERDEL